MSGSLREGQTERTKKRRTESRDAASAAVTVAESTGIQTSAAKKRRRSV
jgi:hypothetical protein